MEKIIEFAFCLIAIGACITAIPIIVYFSVVVVKDIWREMILPSLAEIRRRKESEK